MTIHKGFQSVNGVSLIDLYSSCRKTEFVYNRLCIYKEKGERDVKQTVYRQTAHAGVLAILSALFWKLRPTKASISRMGRFWELISQQYLAHDYTGSFRLSSHNLFMSCRAPLTRLLVGQRCVIWPPPVNFRIELQLEAFSRQSWSKVKLCRPPATRSLIKKKKFSGPNEEGDAKEFITESKVWI